MLKIKINLINNKHIDILHQQNDLKNLIKPKIDHSFQHKVQIKLKKHKQIDL